VPEGGANCADPYAARLAVGNATREANSASSWGRCWVGLAATGCREYRPWFQKRDAECDLAEYPGA